MNPRVVKILAGGLTATALSAAASLTVFAQTTPTPQQPGQFLNAVAAKLGKSPDDVLSAFKTAEHDLVNQAVQAGKLTQDQANKLNARIDQAKGLPLVRGILNRDKKLAETGVAQFLGMQPKDLAAELKQGKSLAQVAQEKGKTVDQLKTFLTQQAKAKLDAQVQAGKMTEARENAALQRLNSNLDKLVNRTGKARTKASL